MRLILGSASPRRAELLSAAGFTFDVRVADVDERVRPGERPHDYVRRLALEKSAAVLDRLESTLAGDPGVLVLAADTSVIVDDTILGKPADDADAERMLRSLSGRAHLVLTGVSVRGARAHLDEVEETRVFVKPLSKAEIAWYVASGEGRDKAGAYAIQGLASRFITRIEGSYTNVVGLPVARVAELVSRLADG
ncbi:MAG: nucleoside triphosphate pyrophosphatase [Vicinamibacterales bacterium]